MLTLAFVEYDFSCASMKCDVTNTMNVVALFFVLMSMLMEPSSFAHIPPAQTG